MKLKMNESPPCQTDEKYSLSLMGLCPQLSVPPIAWQPYRVPRPPGKYYLCFAWRTRVQVGNLAPTSLDSSQGRLWPARGKLCWRRKFFSSCTKVLSLLPSPCHGCFHELTFSRTGERRRNEGWRGTEKWTAVFHWPLLSPCQKS